MWPRSSRQLGCSSLCVHIEWMFFAYERQLTINSTNVVKKLCNVVWLSLKDLGIRFEFYCNNAPLLDDEAISGMWTKDFSQGCIVITTGIYTCVQTERFKYILCAAVYRWARENVRSASIKVAEIRIRRPISMGDERYCAAEAETVTWGFSDQTLLREVS